MSITYNEHIKTVNDALYDLILSEFTKIKIRYCRDFESEYLGSNGQYIRFFYENDEFLGRHTDGEIRIFHYTISQYHDQYKYNKRDEFENEVAKQSDRLTTLICDDPSYILSGATIWFDANMDREYIEMLDDEDNKTNIIEMKHDLRLTRGLTW